MQIGKWIYFWSVGVTEYIAEPWNEQQSQIDWLERDREDYDPYDEDDYNG